MQTRYYRLLGFALTIVGIASCGKNQQTTSSQEGPDASVSPTRSEEAEVVDRADRVSVQPLKAYEKCKTSADCGELACVEAFGSKVCAAVGCADSAEVCVSTETCVVSETIEPSGFCALTGTADYCGQNCRDFLVCSLDTECVQRGCCGQTDGSCSDACSALDAMECEIDPRCPVECCQ